MPRPKKTTPTVATTEPDTTLNPDRAQVAAVADLPHAPRIVVDSIPESATVTVALVDRVPDRTLTIAMFYEAERFRAMNANLAGMAFEVSPEVRATIMREAQGLQTFESPDPSPPEFYNGMPLVTNPDLFGFRIVPAATVGQVSTSAPATPEAMDDLRATIAEQSARIAELTAERDAIQHHHDEWMKFRGDADLELANLRRDGREEDRNRIAELEAELAATRTAPEPTPTRPVATWTGDVLLTPGGKVLGRVNVSRGTFGHLQAAPIYYPADDQERLGPIGTIETAREWVSDYARKIGWVVA